MVVVHVEVLQHLAHFGALGPADLAYEDLIGSASLLAHDVDPVIAEGLLGQLLSGLNFHWLSFVCTFPLPWPLRILQPLRRFLPLGKRLICILTQSLVGLEGRRGSLV